ncbi:MAG: pantetheine-phosphate adenylyltransferase [Planctomycetota bacterium]
MTVALYPGTFDPVTHGHLDIVRRGTRLFERVVIAVGARAGKVMLFTTEERVALLREAVKDLAGVSVATFDGLVVDFAAEQGAQVLLRGVRMPSDYEYEAQMAVTNHALSPELETALLIASPETAFISSTLIKEVLEAGGSVAPFVPPHVAAALDAKRR